MNLTSLNDECIRLSSGNHNQLTAGEYYAIGNEILRRAPCKLLVFGCGMDSNLWRKCNSCGLVKFIENNPFWTCNSNDVVIVSYPTRRSQWKQLLVNPKHLSMELPTPIRSIKWDIIFVDGPTGYNDNQPGRMMSIYEANKLVSPNGTVFIHDIDRDVESAYAQAFHAGTMTLQPPKLLKINL